MFTLISVMEVLFTTTQRPGIGFSPRICLARFFDRIDPTPPEETSGGPNDAQVFLPDKRAIGMLCLARPTSRSRALLSIWRQANSNGYFTRSSGPPPPGRERFGTQLQLRQ